ncbi:MAG: transglutaminase domain-containing protein [Candidatus Pacearchaeota archaeon]
MKKRAGTLLFISIMILIILIPLIAFKFTGFLVNEPEKNVKLSFYDETTNCPLGGYIFIGDNPIGKTENKEFQLSYSNFITNFNESDKLSIFGKLGECFNENPDLYFDIQFIKPNIQEYHFLGDSSFEFKTKITPYNPVNREFLGFIQPEKVKDNIDNLNLINQPENDLSKIANYLSNNIDYKEEEDNSWQTPLQTLSLKSGDCEDFSVLLLSMFYAYNPKLNCYSLIFDSHVSTICYYNQNYAYFDKDKSDKINNPNKKELEYFNNKYLESYELKNSFPKYAFNDLEIVSFNQNEEFLNWQLNLANEKKQENIFDNIEKKVSENNENLPDVALNSELHTQSILSNSKNYYLLLIPIALIIIASFLFLKFRKQKQ